MAHGLALAREEDLERLLGQVLGGQVLAVGLGLHHVPTLVRAAHDLSRKGWF